MWPSGSWPFATVTLGSRDLGQLKFIAFSIQVCFTGLFCGLLGTWGLILRCGFMILSLHLGDPMNKMTKTREPNYLNLEEVFWAHFSNVKCFLTLTKNPLVASSSRSKAIKEWASYALSHPLLKFTFENSWLLGHKTVSRFFKDQLSHKLCSLVSKFLEP